MEAVLRAAIVYAVLLVLFRIAGKRALGQITTFDFVLLLVISEAVQNAMVGQNYSITHAFLVVATLMVMDVGLSLVKRRAPIIDKLVDGVPVILVEHGRPLTDRLKKSRVDESDIMASARRLHGLQQMAEIKYAILERSGDISIIPWEQPEARRPG